MDGDVATQLIGALPLILAILSGPSTVAVGILLRESMRHRRQKRSIESLVVAYLDEMVPAIAALSSFFGYVAGDTSWNENTLGVLLLLAKESGPLDTSFFDDKIRSNILNLDSSLAFNVLRFQRAIRELNWEYRKTSRLVSKDSPLFEFESATASDKLKAETISGWLKKNSKSNEKISELGPLIAGLADQLKTSLITNTPSPIDWDPIEKKRAELVKERSK